MSTMLETLIAGAVKRQDDKRYQPIRRPAPTRPRELFEAFGALGRDATTDTVMRALSWHGSDARGLTYAILGRFMTADELEAAPPDFTARPYARSLLFSPEFRARVQRRILEAYPEKDRWLFIHVPRCGGVDLMGRLGMMNPVLPAALASTKAVPNNQFFAALGRPLGAFGSTKNVLVELPSLALAVHSSATPFPTEGEYEPSVTFEIDNGAYRPTDRLFTILRHPEALIVSHVNAALTRMRRDEAQGGGGRQMPALDDDISWKRLARRMLVERPLINPICQALGDGTASGAVSLCRTANIEIADLARYDDWLRASFETEPDGRANASEVILTQAELTAEDRAAIAETTGEDQLFYQLVADQLAASGMPSMQGAVL